MASVRLGGDGSAALVRSVRQAMVRDQVAARGVRDPLVLEAMQRVPREVFVPQRLEACAYQDRPLPIGEGQTISQPFIVAYMIEALRVQPGAKVLEVGAGSGYAAAVLGEITGQVYAIERVGPLARLAASNLAKAGYDAVQVQQDDGTMGWPEEAPFDAILVSAAGPAVPERLKHQLAVGGRMVIPVGEDQMSQRLVRITRRDATQFDREDLGGVAFVPLIGKEGWLDDEAASLE